MGGTTSQPEPPLSYSNVAQDAALVSPGQAMASSSPTPLGAHYDAVKPGRAGASRSAVVLMAACSVLVVVLGVAFFVNGTADTHIPNPFDESVDNNSRHGSRQRDHNKSNLSWWKGSVVYQVYPRSFYDSDGDGVGDLNGITAHLRHLVDLQVDCVWMSPIFESPMKDFGYDISDYTAIADIFGTMDDFEALMKEAHTLGLKVILDLVPNHTSDKHSWFAESKSSRTSLKRDWYVWRDPKPDGSPPNNWLSEFGGSGWTLDEATGQYYYHRFLKEQPDLNYDNPEVFEAIASVMRFWLDKGIDGFRVDAVPYFVEDPRMRDEPVNPDYKEGDNPIEALLHTHTANTEGTHEMCKRMRSVFDEYRTETSTRLFIGETVMPLDVIMEYYGTDGDEIELPYNFNLMFAEWSVTAISALVEDFEKKLTGTSGWPSWVISTHDQHRVATRIGEEYIRTVNTLLLTLRGTPTIYYGDEIGMHNVHIPKDRIRDPAALNQPELADKIGRDPERTPMQWSPLPNAGFSSSPDVEPWLPIADDFKERNVEVQLENHSSDLFHFKMLTKLRRKYAALAVGKYLTVRTPEHPDVFAYTRYDADEQFVIVLNIGKAACTVDVTSVGVKEGYLELSSDLTRRGLVSLSAVPVAGAEAIIIRLS